MRPGWRLAIVLLAGGAAWLCLPHAAARADADWQRCAELELRVGGIFRVGTALLYLDQCTDAQRILEPIPKKFSLQLARALRGQDLTASARSTLQQNLALTSADELPAPLRCMADAYVDAEQGDRYDVVFEPQRGLSLYLNGDLLRQCGPAEGAEKYFMIWFGEQPFHRRLRDRLLEEALARSPSAS